MFVYRDEGPLLSLLKGGRGILHGGAEFDCLDTGKSLTLSGQQILKPTEHGCGSTSRPYRTKQVAIPRTYATKRGHHVYLTAPEDMIVGSKCHLIERELLDRDRTCRQVAEATKTTTRLSEKALVYDEKEEKERDTLPPGHYNKFYLEYLSQQQQQRPRSAAEESMQGIDIDVSMPSKGGGDADSGVGTSQFKSTDRLTPFSDDATFVSTSCTAILPSSEDQEAGLGGGGLDELVRDPPTSGDRTGKSKKTKGKKGTKTKKGKKSKPVDPSEVSKEELPSSSGSKKKKKTKSSKKAKECEPSAGSSSVKKQAKTSLKKKSCVNSSVSKVSPEKPLKSETPLKSSKYSLDEDLKSLQREKDRLARTREEERLRIREEEEEARRKGEHNTNLRNELTNYRVSHGISQPWKFSYFEFVPPKTAKSKEKSVTGKQRPKAAKLS